MSALGPACVKTIADFQVRLGLRFGCAGESGDSGEPGDSGEASPDGAEEVAAVTAGETENEA